MKYLQLLSVICAFAFAAPATAQEVPDPISVSLGQQGFVITSKRYTWLGRIYVEATNGEVDRAILIARGSGQIPQDNWLTKELSAPDAAANDGDTKHDGNGATSPTSPPPPPPPPRAPSEGRAPAGGRP